MAIDDTRFDADGSATAMARVLNAMTGLNKQATTEQSSAADIVGFSNTVAPQPTETAPATAATVAPGSPSDSSIVDPVPAGTGVNSPFGPRGSGFHAGIDLGVPLNTQLLAAQSGRVTHAANDDPGGYGEWLEITTGDGHKIRYGHLHSVNVKVGDMVSAGQVVASSGGEAGGATSGDSTGAHLHFEVRDPSGNPMDPTPWLAGGHAIVNAAPPTITTHVPDVQAQDAVDTALGRITETAQGNPDPGSENTKTKDVVTQAPGQPGQPGQPGATGDSDPGAIDAFLAATRKHESGGNYHIYNQSGLSNASGAYQFIGSTWRSMGGTTANAADASPAEQDAVARKMATDLFNQFHSWRLVAIAWYGGPGVAQQVASGKDPGAPDQQGGYLDYGNTIQQMMARGEGA